MGIIRKAIPTYQWGAKPSGVVNLDPYLTINSTTVSPTLRYKGGDANLTDWVAWGFGATLPFQSVSGGTNPLLNQNSPLMGVADDSVKFNGGGYYLCGDTTTGNVGTDDLVFSLVFRSTGTTQVLAAKRNAGVGWQIGIDADDKLYLTIQDEDAAVTTVSAVLSTTYPTWYHALIYADRSGSCQIYLYGLASGSAVDISATEKTLDAAVALAIGSDSNGSSPSNCVVAYFGMWHGAAWLNTHTQTTLSATLFYQLIGFYPEVANGTAAPVLAARSSVAYLDKYNASTAKRSLFYVSDNWLRQCQRMDANGTIFRGYLPESYIQNEIVESEDFATTWAKLDAGDTVTANNTACPDKRVKASKFVADSTDGQHGVYIEPTLTADTYTFSVFAKKGNNNWIKVEDADVANCYCYFNVSTGAVGTTGAGVLKALLEGPFDNDFYRCGIIFTGTAAAHTLQILSASADNDDTFSGNGSTANMYLWGAQCEGHNGMTSPIITDGGTATRDNDTLRFSGIANFGGSDKDEVVVCCDVLMSGIYFAPP